MKICMENMAEIMDAYMPLIRANARKFSRFDFDELVDESKGSFGNFLKLSLWYHCLDKSKKDPVVSLDDYDSKGDPLMDGLEDDFDFENDLIRNEEYSLLYEAIDNLAEVDQKIIWLKYIYSYPNAEVADIMGLSYKTVANRSSLALKELRKILK